MTARRRGGRGKKARAKAYNKQRGRCFWCGIGTRLPSDRAASSRHLSLATIEHLTPWSLGGRNGAANIVSACENCNHKRGNMPIPQWLEVLKGRLQKMMRTHHFEVVLSWLAERGIHAPTVGHPLTGPDPTSFAASPPQMDSSPAP